MINRISATILEDAGGKPVASQFGADCAFVIPEAGGFYTVYKKREGNRHLAATILWKHSPGLYAIFGASTRISAMGTAKNCATYSALPTNAWRVYECAGTDSAIDPITGKAIGAFTGRFVRFTSQPPAVISTGSPYTFGTLKITSAVPSIDCTVSGFDFPTNAKAAADPINGTGDLLNSVTKEVKTK
jgi:hypothetical protein